MSFWQLDKPLISYNLPIEDFDWNDFPHAGNLNFHLTKDEFLGLPLLHYIYYSINRIGSSNDTLLKDYLTSNLLSIFSNLNQESKKKIFYRYLNNIGIKDFGNDIFLSKYLSNTSLSNWTSWDYLFKKPLTSNYSQNQNLALDYIINQDTISYFNNKETSLLYQTLFNNNSFLDNTVNEVEQIFDPNFSNLEKTFCYLQILHLEIIYEKTPNVHKNLTYMSEIFKNSFSDLIEAIKSKESYLSQYNLDISHFNLIYAISGISNVEKNQQIIKLVNNMLDSEDETFYEHNLLKLFYTLISYKYLNKNDIVSSSLPLMLNSLWTENPNDDGTCTIVLNLVKLKRAMVLYHLTKNESWHNEVFKTIKPYRSNYHRPFLHLKTVDLNNGKGLMYNGLTLSKNNIFNTNKDLSELLVYQPFLSINKTNSIPHEPLDEPVKANVIFHLRKHVKIKNFRELLILYINNSTDSFKDIFPNILLKMDMENDIVDKHQSLTKKIKKF